MKTFISAFFLLVVACLRAQNPCTFDPVITNGDIILCPNATDTLRVGGGPYDAYQWLRDGQPIAGATDSILPVEQYADSGYHFSVQVDSAGCTETSPEILIDSWAFLLPSVFSEGEFTVDPEDGTLLVCEGDLLRLTLNQPYTTNIQWTLNDEVIPGADAPMLVVTAPGFYHVTAAPGLCPDFILALGVYIGVEFLANPLPVISLVNGQLVCSAAADDYLWYLNGTPIGNSNSQSITPGQSGTYTVGTYMDNGCTNLSAPYTYQSTRVVDPNNDLPVRLFPQPASDRITVEAPGLRRAECIDAYGRLVAEAEGEDVLRLQVAEVPAGWYSVRLILASGETAVRKVVVGR